MSKAPLISIIVPVYNEAANLPKFHQVLARVLEPMPYRYEIFYVDDGSRDRSLEVLDGLSKANTKIRLIELSRNFGKEIAMTAGLNACRGDAAIIIDADLQHPPELIPKFVSKWVGGPKW